LAATTLELLAVFVQQSPPQGQARNLDQALSDRRELNASTQGIVRDVCSSGLRVWQENQCGIG
jgi:hypothetical protein